MLFRIRIVRMHLNAQVVRRVNDLHQKRKTIAFCIAEQLRFVFPQFGQPPPVIGSPGRAHDGVSRAVRADGPAFAGPFSRYRVGKLRLKSVSSPNGLFVDRLCKKQSFHLKSYSRAENTVLISDSILTLCERSTRYRISPLISSWQKLSSYASNRMCFVSSSS